MTFGDTVDEAESTAIVEEAAAGGITWIDTANSYAAGRTEEIVGRLLAGREDVVLATRVGQPHPEVGRESLLAPARMRTALEGSLRRLRRDRIDLLYLHEPDRSTPLVDTLSCVADLVREGKVGALGVSNYSAWQVAELLRIADDIACPRPVVGQQIYNLLARRLDEEYVEFAAAAGLPTMAYNPLAGGPLTGRYRNAEDVSTGRFATFANAAQYRARSLPQPG
jgi:aryl-alcohol dehydrogenase-like predicted oxidoreductase